MHTLSVFTTPLRRHKANVLQKIWASSSDYAGAPWVSGGGSSVLGGVYGTLPPGVNALWSAWGGGHPLATTHR